jgi:hypothetical protein
MNLILLWRDDGVTHWQSFVAPNILHLGKVTAGAFRVAFLSQVVYDGLILVMPDRVRVRWLASGCSILICMWPLS